MEDMDEELTGPTRPSNPGPRPRNVNTGGWGFGDGGDSGFDAPSGGGGGGRGGGGGVEAPRGFADDPGPSKPETQTNKKHMDDDDDGVIPVIPDLEDEAEEDITRQVAAPPVAHTTNLRTARELEAAQGQASRGLSQLQTNQEDGIDLAVLTMKLCGEMQVFEEDVAWDPELIFQEVASEINAELNTSSGNEDGIPDNPATNGTDRVGM